MSARSILRITTTSPSVAGKAADKLVRQWPHAKPPDADAWIDAIATALECYPPGIVAECVDPRIGLFKTREFPPTGVAVHDWCAARLEYHAKWAKYAPRPKLIEKPYPTQKHPGIGQWLSDLAKRLLFPAGRATPQFKSRGPSDDELRAYYGKPQSEAAE